MLTGQVEAKGKSCSVWLAGPPSSTSEHCRHQSPSYAGGDAGPHLHVHWAENRAGTAVPTVSQSPSQWKGEKGMKGPIRRGKNK